MPVGAAPKEPPRSLEPDSTPTRLTNNPELDLDAAWSPDGTKIAFMSGRDGPLEIYVMNAEGRGPVNLTTNPAGSDAGPSWRP